MWCITVEITNTKVLIQAFQEGVVPGIFTCLKWSLVPPDFKECCIRYSWKQKVSDVNSEVLVDLKNIKWYYYVTISVLALLLFQCLAVKAWGEAEGQGLTTRPTKNNYKITSLFIFSANNLFFLAVLFLLMCKHSHHHLLQIPYMWFFSCVFYLQCQISRCDDSSDFVATCHQRHTRILH